MTASSQARERISSRELLLRAAADLMVERGTINVSLSEIAQRSQLNAALVKYYFGSKNGLMLALLEDVVGASLEQMRGLLTMDLTIVEKLKLHIKGIINVYFRHPFINRLMHAMLQEPDLAKRVSDSISKPLADTQRALLLEGIRSGHFKDVDPMMFYFIVLGACDHLFFSRHVLRYAFGVEAIDEELRRSYTAAVLDLVLGGILAEPNGVSAKA